MERRRPLIVLLLALTLVGQGIAFAQSSVTMSVPRAAADDSMPCHTKAQDVPACCEQGSSCPDMLVCLTGFVALAATGFVLPSARADLTASRLASPSAATRPPTVFRPPIVISA